MTLEQTQALGGLKKKPSEDRRTTGSKESGGQRAGGPMCLHPKSLSASRRRREPFLEAALPEVALGGEWGVWFGLVFPVGVSGFSARVWLLTPASF